MAKYKRAFFREGDRYIFLTGAAPRGFAGVLGITWEGPLDQLTETARPLDQLAKLEQVEPETIPLAWWEGFRKTSGLLAERKTPPAAPLAAPPAAPRVKEGWTLIAAVVIGVIVGFLTLRWIP